MTCEAGRADSACSIRVAEMAKARAIVKRRKAVQNIRKITQTMQLISTARYQRCLQRATASKPYTERITALVQTVAETQVVQQLLQALESDVAGEEADGGPERRALQLLRPNTGVARSVLLTITSNRGLCGAYNASILRVATEHRQRLVSEGTTPDMDVVGKKGINYLRFLKVPVAEKITDIDDHIAYARVAEMAERYMRAYEAGEIARLDVAYTRFQSVGVQRPMVGELLPITPLQRGEERERQPARPQFEFSPSPTALLGRLIPEAVRARLYQYFNDAILSEQVARMVAMKAATDAAGDMIKYLTRQYNRARQTQITLELADIVGGSNAVS